MKLFRRRKKESEPPVPPSEIFTDNVEELRLLPPGVRGGIDLYGRRFFFHDACSFYVSHKEILAEEIYKFNPTAESPLIIDCGANMGVSVLYFSREYPTARIVAFEPEAEIFSVLQKNIAAYGLTNVEMHQKAVWDRVTELEFTTDRGMGGSVTNAYTNQTPVKVHTVRLADYLQQRVSTLR